ncbi:hypothetical protein HDU83_009859 [Entophlyctis luteolus]|nr:hypothetical protein HDU83_009859 [Entophlyctis luteolus]
MSLVRSAPLAGSAAAYAMSRRAIASAASTDHAANRPVQVWMQHPHPPPQPQPKRSALPAVAAVTAIAAIGLAGVYYAESKGSINSNVLYKPPLKVTTQEADLPVQVDAAAPAASERVWIQAPGSIVRRIDTASAVVGDDTTKVSTFTGWIPGNAHAQLIVALNAHDGPECLDIVQKYLAAYVTKSICVATNGWFGVPDRNAAIIAAIKAGYEMLDKDITSGAFLDAVPNYKKGVQEQRELLATRLRQAISGSGALVALIDKTDLYVASVGNLSAVVGVRNADDTFYPVELPPADPSGPQRGFGHAFSKWPSALASKLPGTAPTGHSATTAVPVITHTVLRTGSAGAPADAFLVVSASPGTSARETVDIVHAFNLARGVISPSIVKVWGSNPLTVGRWDVNSDENAAACVLRNTALAADRATAGAAAVVFFGDEGADVNKLAESVDIVQSLEQVDLKLSDAKTALLPKWVKWLDGAKKAN